MRQFVTQSLTERERKRERERVIERLDPWDRKSFCTVLYDKH